MICNFSTWTNYYTRFSQSRSEAKNCVKVIHKKYSQDQPEAKWESETRKVRMPSKDMVSGQEPRRLTVAQCLGGWGKLEIQCGSTSVIWWGSWNICNTARTHAQLHNTSQPLAVPATLHPPARRSKFPGTCGSLYASQAVGPTVGPPKKGKKTQVLAIGSECT